jgi:lipopolysaccharide biosynthesis glycosyltransferase
MNSLDKKYTWCFAGQVHAQGDRSKMIDLLKKCNGEYHLHVAEGWQSGNSLSTQEYKKILSDSIFVPCPRGNTSVDTFRLYEALEVGAIPIVEKSDYWSDMLGEHPLIETASWNNISNDINLLLENTEWIIKHSKKVQSWWVKYKQQLKQDIANIIAEKRKVYDVCFCCDENLINYIVNPVNALSQKNKDKSINIHLIYSGKESELIPLKQFIENKNNLNLKVYLHSEIAIKTEKSCRSIDHLSSATNLKLKIPEILLGVSRVLYFDIDTIPFVDLSLFDDIKLNKSGVALKPEIKNGWRTFNGSKGTATENKNPVEFGDKIIGNTGVMLLNLDLLRQNKFTEKCFEIKKTNHQKIPLTGGDQDIINIYCRCDYTILSDNLNCLSSEQFVSVEGDILVSQNYETGCKLGEHFLKKSSLSSYKSFVLHFIGKDKPWNSDCSGANFWQKFSIDNKKKQNSSQIDSQKHKEFLRLKDEWSNLVGRDYLKYISKHLNQVDVPKEKFTVYNPGKKIAIVSLYTPEIADYAICSEMSVRDYCLANGYTFYVYREKLQADASANWSKARAILNHFDDHEDIVWMDSDTIIYNPQKRFEDILSRCTGTKKIIACEDIGTNNKKITKGMMLNSGVVVFRNHSYTKNIIRKWMNADCDKSSLYASGGDQGILCDVLKESDGFGFNRKIFPMNEFNTEPRFVDEHTFILHFMAYPFELKKIFMRYFIES